MGSDPLAKALYAAAGKRWQQIGQSRPWASGLSRAAMRQLPAAQPLMAVNGRFCHRRRTAPDLMQTLKGLGWLSGMTSPPDSPQRSSSPTLNQRIPFPLASTRSLPIAHWLREHRARARDLFAAEPSFGIGKNVEHTAVA